ncbi:ATP phosphoribosyltransferase regulatory subunit [Ectothiorhodospira haloalkaliphila]|uniref:ATP phosphoribosyltransferase regulatory subunit n=1 Tax=Ectothiorhodospira haloalkaliphila TaxID=421628 RepID=W8KN50_9GAMM|nr:MULTISPECIES: ATP phosphoribosyltransferase regulatory subunit [Ectothiorhodospira]AHK78442.1 ATP phosphoribosyltransferase regulatory subunit [Ectothiorhodospira haloalkaliphila]MCG5494509.1 ATP phosphoribosyltransferase regulatory subunit [Ectothiorhodospira variabilis]MCG5498318.1 ATP phosphoribosyltransferase regulatory subunit [Ectothiorhodospira variabilis]MCG5503120.1 ATP phosphoribosyltransferase regulatory subunit [Ectothiorhodospira variabilis]MCG5506121.1 ATP phosphoribosyltransf
MTDSNRWLLPEGVEEALPPLAERLETCRRQLLDLYHGWGYQLVMPPFIEYLESLLTGTGRGLDLQTFKLTDQLNGRLMGVRADMTPQVARIDAHRLKCEAPSRLCYMGTVLHTRPDGFAGSRSLLQVGAELYGHSGLDSDLEILSLMLETLDVCQVDTPLVDLGHVGIYRALAVQAGMDPDQEITLFDMLQRKALPEIREYLGGLAMEDAPRRRLSALAELNGGDETLARAREVLAGAGDLVSRALDDLEQLAEGLRARYPAVLLHFDLAELRGYHYHTGLVFAAYRPGNGQEVARGGRYDDIGRVFGRARPATGFSADLKTLVRLSGQPESTPARAIFAPADPDTSLAATVTRLRREGERVIQGLSGQTADAAAMGCDRVLVKSNNQWTVVDA